MEKKQRTQIAITAVLVLVLVFAWANTAKSIKKRSPAPPKPQAAASPAVTPASALPPESRLKEAPAEEAAQKLEWVRDPFSGKIYTGKESGPVSFKLDGIIWDEKNPLALINGRILKVGDRISSNRIIRINPDRVILNDGMRDFELKLQ